MSKEGEIGAIVMNCNPFTLGHQYLVEYAAERMSHLYVFVVEEDLSIFPFEDRFLLVQQGVEHLGNVTVVPSGQFIISKATFKEYFIKETQQDTVIDASQDLSIFADSIAPALRISTRFVGEEPTDNVTRQYNVAMMAILPQKGIAVKVIPRREQRGEPISASKVRKLLEGADFDGISELVPITTLDYLREYCKKRETLCTNDKFSEHHKPNKETL